MAAINPWLKDLVEQALADYLNNTQASLEKRSSRFGYKLDNSDLRIWLLAPSQYALTVIEVGSSR